MASTSADWKRRWARRPCTLDQFTRICCGWNPERAWEVPDALLYNRVLATIRLAVRVRDIPIIEDLLYTADDPAPTGHVRHDFDPFATDDEQAAARDQHDRQNVANAPPTLVRLTEMWQWALSQFPDTFPFTAADFSGDSNVQYVDLAAKTTPPSPVTREIEAQTAQRSTPAAEPRQEPPQSMGVLETAGIAAYSFKQGVDGLWEVSYAGEQRVGLKHVEGMALIRTLLAAPGRAFPSARLLQRSGPDGTAPRFGGVPALDAQAQHELKLRLKELTAMREATNERQDAAAIEQAEDEYQEIQDRLTADLGLAGRHRNLGSDVERDRQTASRRYRIACRSIEKFLPTLAGHLKRCIRPGREFVYQPDKQITWLT